MNMGPVCRLEVMLFRWSVGLRSRRNSAAWLAGSVMCVGLLLLSGCMSVPSAPALPAFHEAASADFIFKYYSDQVSHVVKPLTTEGQFLAACDRSALLSLAAKQPRRELAVV